MLRAETDLAQLAQDGGAVGAAGSPAGLSMTQRKFHLSCLNHFNNAFPFKCLLMHYSVDVQV